MSGYANRFPYRQSRPSRMSHSTNATTAMQMLRSGARVLANRRTILSISSVSQRIRCQGMAHAARAPLQNKNVAVIGASRGIGLEFVKQLLNRDNTVHATARKPEEANGLQELAANKKLTLGTLDTSNPDSIEAWASSLRGGQGFQYVFVIAGIHDPTRADLTEIDAERMLRLFQTNSIGPLLVAQQLVKNKLLAEGSVLANMTSKMGSITDNGSGKSYAYRASKAALNQITKSLSIDLQPAAVSVVLLHPGWVRTDMTSNNGLINVDECVSGLLSVLESDKPLNGRFYDYKHDEIPW